MTRRERQRLAALILPLLPQLPPHERAEALRLLGPLDPILPPDAPQPSCFLDHLHADYGHRP